MGLLFCYIYWLPGTGAPVALKPNSNHFAISTVRVMSRGYILQELECCPQFAEDFLKTLACHLVLEKGSLKTPCKIMGH